MPFEAQAVVTTNSASRYLQALCGHFQRKVFATWDAHEGTVTFPLGTCTLRADGAALHLAVRAETAEALVNLQEVVAAHIERFAAKDALTVSWTPTTNQEEVRP